MIADIKKTAEQKMGKTVETLKHDLTKVRTGRAHTGLLDHIHVDYYGSMVPIAIDRSECPPAFSRRIMQARIFAGSRLLPLASSSEAGPAARMRGMNRARICAPQA